MRKGGEGSKRPRVFHDEGPDLYAAALHRNRRWATHDAPWTTELSPGEEARFIHWLHSHHDPGGFNPNAQRTDYDMRGFWRKYHGTDVANMQPGEHFTDEFKTPYDTSFSAESRYAVPGTPFVWDGERLINKRTGAVMYAPR